MIADLTVAFLTYQHRNAVCAAVVVIGVTGAIAEILLREKCELCGVRVKIPMAGHLFLEHAGDQ